MINDTTPLSDYILVFSYPVIVATYGIINYPKVRQNKLFYDKQLQKLKQAKKEGNLESCVQQFKYQTHKKELAYNKTPQKIFFYMARQHFLQQKEYFLDYIKSNSSVTKEDSNR